MDSVTSFFLAIKHNHVEEVEKLLSRKLVDVDHKFAPEKKPAVFLAVECGHREIVECLIRYGCSVNQSDRRGETPLHQAVNDRRKDLVEILLKERAKVSVLNNDRRNAVHLAVHLRCLDIVKILLVADSESVANSSLENCLNLIFQSDPYGVSSPFYIACSKGFDEIVMFFLSLGKRSAKKYLMRNLVTDGMNPLHYTLRLKEETVLALIEILPTDFLVSSPHDYMKWSPLHRLAQAENLLQVKSGQMISILLKNRAPCDVRDVSGRTPLHLALMHKNEPAIEALLRAGCRIDIRDNFGTSAFGFTCYLCAFDFLRIRIIEKLLAFGLDLSRERWITAMMERDHAASFPEYTLLVALADLQRSKALITLHRLCRLAIRHHLKAKADDIIKKLDCIPHAMKMFLLVENEPPVLNLDVPVLS